MQYREQRRKEDRKSEEKQTLTKGYFKHLMWFITSLYNISIFHLNWTREINRQPKNRENNNKTKYYKNEHKTKREYSRLQLQSRMSHRALSTKKMAKEREEKGHQSNEFTVNCNFYMLTKTWTQTHKINSKWSFSARWKWHIAILLFMNKTPNMRTKFKNIYKILSFNYGWLLSNNAVFYSRSLCVFNQL